jgi:hypothetical protein
LIPAAAGSAFDLPRPPAALKIFAADGVFGLECGHRARLAQETR